MFCLYFGEVINFNENILPSVIMHLKIIAAVVVKVLSIIIYWMLLLILCSWWDENFSVNFIYDFSWVILIFITDKVTTEYKYWVNDYSVENVYQKKYNILL